jgi:hypothetical protein
VCSSKDSLSSEFLDQYFNAFNLVGALPLISIPTHWFVKLQHQELASSRDSSKTLLQVQQLEKDSPEVAANDIVIADK